MKGLLALCHQILNQKIVNILNAFFKTDLKLQFIFMEMETEKANDSRSNSKDAGKQAELAFKLYDKVYIFI